MFKKYIFHIFILISVNSFAQDFPKSNDFEAHQRFVDVDTVSIDLEINPFEKTVIGKAKITYVNLSSKVDSFFIHAVDFNLKSVLLNGEKVNYKYLPKGGMWIYPSLSLENRNILEIEYSTRPRKGLFFVGWDDKAGIRKKQIWSQGQGIDNRYWFPSYDLQDEKAIYDIKVSFPKEYNLLASGELLSNDSDSLNTVWHYQTKHLMSSYLVMLAGGEYKFKVESKKLKANGQRLKNIDFQYWYYTGEEDKVEPTYSYTKEIMSFFEQEIGVEYPWNKYAQIPVSDFKHGAMENTEATIFSDTYFCNDTSFVDQNYISVNAHEMAHQWFGDALTCSSSKHHWLHEGFATFYQLKAIDKFIGKDDFIWEKKLYRDLIFEISKRDSLPLTHPKAGTERFYYKGAFVLMMLERELGEVDFKKAIKQYTEDNLFGVVETETLKSSFEKTLNVDLTSFFNQWIYGFGEPKVEINYFEKGRNRGLAINQIGEVFNFELPINIKYKRRKIESLTFEVTTSVDTLFFDRKVDFFEVDPNVESLVFYDVIKPISQWENQIVDGSTSYSRWLSLTNVGSLSEKEKLNVYSEINLKTENYKVLSEVFSQLSMYNSVSATKLKNELLLTKNTDLIKEIISNTKVISIDERQYFENYLNTKSYLVIAGALDLLCESFPEDANKYLDKTERISGASIPFVKLSWLKNAVDYGSFTNTEKQIFADELVSFTSNSYGFNTRLLALNKVFEIQYFNRELLLNLINGSVSFNHHLVGPYRQVMKKFAKNESFRQELNLILEQEKLTEKEMRYLKQLLE